MTFYHINRKKNSVLYTLTFIPESDPTISHIRTWRLSADGLASSHPHLFAWIHSAISDTYFEIADL